MLVSALACRSKARVTTPLPILALLRPFVATLCFALSFRDVVLHCLRYAILCLCVASHSNSIAWPRHSVANIASHSAAKPDCALPLRSTSNLYSAVATNCIPKPLRTQHCPTKPLLRYAAPSHALATLCRTMPLPNIAINAAAIRARHGATPPLRFVALPCHCVAWLGLSQQFPASPLPSKPIAALLCHCFAVPITAAPGPAIALNRALRRRIVPFRSFATGRCL